jgi:guanylate kinase
MTVYTGRDMIITLTGASGTGKTTIAQRFIAELPDCAMLTSHTTRAPRPSDIAGEYEYLSEEQFDELRQASAFEWTTPPMRGKNYGTKKDLLDAAFRLQGIRLMIVVPEAMHNLYTAADARGIRSSIRSFFIKSPSAEILTKRLMEARGLDAAGVAIDAERCRDWEDQARASGLPYIYIEDTDDLNAKYQKIASTMLGKNT